MAKYSKGAQNSVEDAMHRMKRGKLESGKSGKKVKNRKQAIAIGLSEAREKGAKVPSKKSSKKKVAKKSTSSRKGTKKRASKRARKKSSRGRAKKSR